MNTTFEKLNTLTSVRDDVERMMSAYECDRDGCMICRYRTTRPSGKRRISCCVAEIGYATKKALQLYE